MIVLAAAAYIRFLSTAGEDFSMRRKFVTRYMTSSARGVISI
jgi:hypothetical protein